MRCERTFVRRMGACEEARVAGTVPDALVSFCHLIYAVNKTKYRPVLMMKRRGREAAYQVIKVRAAYRELLT